MHTIPASPDSVNDYLSGPHDVRHWRTIFSKPVGGFLIFPFAILKTYGSLSRTLAAFWAIPSIRKTGRATVNLKTVARYGCIPLGTLKRQKRELERCEIIINPGRIVEGPARVEIDSEFLKVFYSPRKKGQGSGSPEAWGEWRGMAVHLDQLQVPRSLLVQTNEATGVIDCGLRFSEVILLTYYRYRCRSHEETKHYCTDTFPQIVGAIGFDVETWKRAARKLVRWGYIERVKEPHTRFAVWLPEPKKMAR